MTEGSGHSGESGATAAKPRKTRIPGVVSIDAERCKGCGFCVSFCPLGVLRMSTKFNAKGYHYPEVADADKCSGCGLCGMYCPDFAIFGARSSGVIGSGANPKASDAE